MTETTDTASTAQLWTPRYVTTGRTSGYLRLRVCLRPPQPVKGVKTNGYAPEEGATR